MLDLDDPAQLALSDRSGLLARAAEPSASPSAAALTSLVGGRALPAEGAPLWLHLPESLAGVGRIVQDLTRGGAGVHPVLLWRPALMPLLGAGHGAHTWLSVGPAPDPAAPRLPLEALLDEDAHPAETLLSLLSLLDAWLGTKLAAQASNGSTAMARELAHCRPEIKSDENPAKQLARVLVDRVPLIWAEAPFAGVAQVWWQQLTLYAELQSGWMEAESLYRVQSVARFPRWWGQAGGLLQLDAGSPSAAAAGIELLCQRRRMGFWRVAPPPEVSVPASVTAAAAAHHLLRLGEWVALYAAALLGVHPLDRVALDFLAALAD